MNNKINTIKSKKYLILFILVMGINILLAVTLLRATFAQTKKSDFSSQQSIKVAVTEQKDNPLQIVVVNVDNSPLSYQNVVFSLQNISNKPIKAYTLIGKGKTHSGKVITGFLISKRFLTGEFITSSLDIERSVISDEENILLSIDYVEFEDGSFWGDDSQRKSELLAGQREGTKAAITRLQNLCKNQNASILTDFLNQNMQKITVDLPNTKQSDQWNRGFKLGYGSVISIIQEIKEEKREKIIEKINEMVVIANQGGKQ